MSIFQRVAGCLNHQQYHPGGRSVLDNPAAKHLTLPCCTLQQVPSLNKSSDTQRIHGRYNDNIYIDYIGTYCLHVPINPLSLCKYSNPMDPWCELTSNLRLNFSILFDFFWNNSIPTTFLKSSSSAGWFLRLKLFTQMCNENNFN